MRNTQTLRNKRTNNTHARTSTHRLPLPRTIRRGFTLYAAVVLAALLMLTVGATVFADGGEPIQMINNLSTFIFGLIKAIGLILLGFGIVQVGMSLKSHDPSQRANGFLTLAGGIVIFFAKEILDLITA